jgi:hypothetical protein
MRNSLARGYVAIAALAALLVGTAMIVGERPAWGYFDLASSYMMLLTLALPPLLWFCWLGGVVVVRRAEHPSRAIVRLARRNRGWLIRGTILTVCTVPAAKAFSSLKQAIPDLVPFYADPALARIDRWLFFGNDPWRLTHAVMGPVATLVIDRLYLLWFPVMLGLGAWYNFTHDRRLQVRGVLTYLLSWFLLGNVAAALMSSVGPCFYELYYGSTQFRPLFEVLREYDAAYGIRAFDAMNWLYVNRDADRFGSGISAMPSLHVGIAFLAYLTVRHAARARGLRWLAGGFVVVVWIGSVHLGWHYGIDGLFAIFGVAAIWWACGRFVAWCERPPRRAPSPHFSTGAAA